VCPISAFSKTPPLAIFDFVKFWYQKYLVKLFIIIIIINRYRVKREREYNAFGLALDGYFTHSLAILTPQSTNERQKSCYVVRHNESSPPSSRGGVWIKKKI